jgi:hypothetical protein
LQKYLISIDFSQEKTINPNPIDRRRLLLEIHLLDFDILFRIL